MPILKTEILGKTYDISFEEKEKEKLLKLIENFNKRLNEFPKDDRVSSSAIIFLAALKAEDEIEEIKKLQKKQDTNTLGDTKKTIDKLNNEIITLKDEISTLSLSSNDQIKDNVEILNEIDFLTNKIQFMQKKLKNSI
tara:strand:+ start:125 stop:538 length:414 start_codon:yes stop_codon:yes gene_type:complete